MQVLIRLNIVARYHALRRAKCAPQNAMSAPRHSAVSPASTPAMVGTELGAAAAWPAAASTSTPMPTRNWRMRRGICPDTALMHQRGGKIAAG